MEPIIIGPALAVLFEEDYGKKYLLVDTIGAGMWGTVMLVKDVVTGKLYARKMEATTHEKTITPQSREVRLHKTHPNIPQLITFREYPQDLSIAPDPNVPDYQQGIDPPRVATATVWQYCNGGTLGAMAASHLELNRRGLGNVWKMPDQFIWSLFKTMLDVQILLSMTEPCIAHGDSHQDNWFLHWESDQAEYPQLFLGDYGSSLGWPGLNNRWHAEQIWSNISAGTYGPFEDLARNNWHDVVQIDHQFSVRALQYFILKPFNFTALPNFQVMFRNAAAQGTSLYGYSPMLIKLICQWYYIVEKERYSPENHTGWYNFYNEIHRLRDMVHAQADLEATHVPRCHNDLNVQQLRLPPASTTPRTWTDVTVLLPFRKTDQGDWVPKPATLELSRNLTLRPGEYTVVELGRVSGEEGPTPILHNVRYFPRDPAITSEWDEALDPSIRSLGHW